MFVELFNNTNMMWYFLQVRLLEDIPVIVKTQEGLDRREYCVGDGRERVVIFHPSREHPGRLKIRWERSLTHVIHAPDASLVELDI